MELVRTEPYDYVEAEKYPSVPELILPNPTHTIWVRWGQLRVGADINTFASEGFWECTGFIFGDKARKGFGLMHALPGRRLGNEPAALLRSFDGGYVLPVEGAACIENTEIKGDFSKLNLSVLDPVKFEVHDKRGQAQAVQIVFRPNGGELLVARNSVPDLLVFKDDRLGTN